MKSKKKITVIVSMKDDSEPEAHYCQVCKRKEDMLVIGSEEEYNTNMLCIPIDNMWSYYVEESK